MAEPDLSKRIVYQVEAMRDVRVQRDIVYRSEGDTELTLDVYAPAGPSDVARAPAVFFIHGGPIPKEMTAPTRWGIYESYGELAAASGLVGVTFNHRLYAPTDYGNSQADIAGAIAFVREHSAELNVDPERIALWAFSGGGAQLSPALRERPPYIRCLLGFYPLLDLRHVAPENADAATLANISRISPAAHVRAKGADLPIFIARAGLDAPMINQSIDVFVQEALAGNARLDLMNHPQGRHTFDALDDDDRSRDIIGRAIAFTQMHVRSA